VDIFSRVRALNLPAGQYAVFGSALLDAWGIRRAVDLDIVATPELYAKLKADGWEEKQAHGFPMLVRGEANVTTVQNKPTDGEYCPDRLALVREAVVVGDVPFVKIEEVVACKRAYNRPKDRKDIASIERYIESRGNKGLYS